MLMITLLNRNKRMLAWIFSWWTGSSWLRTNWPMMLQCQIDSTRVRKPKKETHLRLETKLDMKYRVKKKRGYCMLQGCSFMCGLALSVLCRTKAVSAAEIVDTQT